VASTFGEVAPPTFSLFSTGRKSRRKKKKNRKKNGGNLNSNVYFRFELIDNTRWRKMKIP
jgi:hypothetical protein